MANANSKISWCDASWGPVTGCSRVSAGCASCYAERLSLQMHKRWVAMGKTPEQIRHAGFTSKPWTAQNAAENVICHWDRLEIPLKWKQPKKIFITSMSDLYHDLVPDAFIDKVMAIVALCPYHTFQNLTKRPERMLDYFSKADKPFHIQQSMDAISVDRRMSKIREEWRPINGYNRYLVSNFGRIVSQKPSGNHELIALNQGNGYLAVALCENGVVHSHLIHRLVLESFIGPPDDGQEACHANGDKTDNRIANLRWGNRTENMADSARHGKAGVWMKARATLTSEQVSEIRIRRESGESLDDIRSDYGATRQQISAICLGRIFKPPQIDWPLRNYWAGVSVENKREKHRIDELRPIPAAIRFISFEPLLEDLGELDLTGIHWAQIGGESGPGFRPMQMDWVMNIYRQCRAQGVSVWAKQIAGYRSEMPLLIEGKVVQEFPAVGSQHEYNARR